MLCHIKRRVAQQLLERERISSAIDKILAGKGVTEKMDRGLFHATFPIVVGNTAPQAVLCVGSRLWNRYEDPVPAEHSQCNADIHSGIIRDV